MSDAAEIASLSQGAGDAGRVSVSSMSDLTLADGSRLSVESQQSNAGNLRVSVGKSLSLDSSSITASAKLDGGNVTVAAKEFVWLEQHSSIKAEAQGNGGNIDLEARFVLLNDSIISANAVNGRGGNIDVSAKVLLSNGDSSITASSKFGINGVVKIDSIFNLSKNTLIEQEVDILELEDYALGLDASKLPNDVSTLLDSGRGGMAPRPGFLPGSAQLWEMPR